MSSLGVRSPHSSQIQMMAPGHESGRRRGSGAGGSRSDEVSASPQNRLDDVFAPGVERAHAAVAWVGDPTQAYCDLLEVRWLLSEQAGSDVSDQPALEALAMRSTPGESAATLGIVDVVTQELPGLPPDLLDDLRDAAEVSDPSDSAEENRH